MNGITQGTMISSMRSERYIGHQCYGIVISARCDLANKKITKVFYLIAIPLEEWILSDAGFSILLSGVVTNIEGSLKDFAKNNDLSWIDLKTFSLEEFEQVVCELQMKNRQAKDIIHKFKKFKVYTTHKYGLREKQSIISAERKSFEGGCMEIVSGKNLQFSYIPEDAINDIINGVVIDHQELDYLTISTAELVDNYKMDVTVLTKEEQEKFNDKFFIIEEPGYSIPLCTIKSPWIEYLMQRFSNMFTRIGVDVPQKIEISNVIDRILAKESD